MHRIATDEMLPEYTRQFASLFRSIFQININDNENKRVAIFSSVCETILMTYLHRVVQIIDNKIDPIESLSEYDELNKMIHSIHHEINTNEHPEWTLKQIEHQLLFI